MQSRTYLSILLLVLFLLLSMGVGLGTATAQAQSRAYVTNNGSNTVSVIDTATTGGASCRNPFVWLS